jgi:hypothetical protein
MLTEIGALMNYGKPSGLYSVISHHLTVIFTYTILYGCFSDSF